MLGFEQKQLESVENSSGSNPKPVDLSTLEAPKEGWIYRALTLPTQHDHREQTMAYQDSGIQANPYLATNFLYVAVEPQLQ
jgi:hypothetical protein